MKTEGVFIRLPTSTRVGIWVWLHVNINNYLFTESIYRKTSDLDFAVLALLSLGQYGKVEV